MPRRPRPPRNQAERPEKSPRTAKTEDAPNAPPAAGERADQLVQLCDYCSSAQRIADAHGEKLLAYLLAMAIQEGQTALRRLTTAQAATLSE